MAAMVTQLNAVGRNETSQVLKALENPEYVWRTTKDLSSDTHLSKNDVVLALHQLPDPVLVMTSGKQGRLYTMRELYNKTQSFWGKLLRLPAVG